jgi:hypothetical protein
MLHWELMMLAPFITKALRWWPAVLALFATGFGAVAVAMLQMHNADQLVNSFLFENYHTFRGAIFPAEHTQLVKWPLFVIPHFFHFAPAAYTVLTVIVVLATVGALLYVLYRIDRRMVVFGALCIMLVSVLLLVPAQAFDGGVTAPLNMAMLTGRNLEYVLYLAVLALLAKTPGLRSWFFAGGTLLLSLLFASDRLFTYCSFGGVALLTVLAIVTNHKAFQRLGRTWLFMGAIAWVLSVGWQAAIGHALVRLASYPQHYEHIATLTGLRQGIAGTLHALALNFGLTTRGGVISLPAFILNVFIVILIMYATYWMIRQLYHLRGHSAKLPRAYSFAAMLLATSLAMIVGFVITNQPYVQNARYLTITLFGGFVTLAVWLRTVPVKVLAAKVRPLLLAGVACVLLAVAATTLHDSKLRANDTLAQRNQKVAAVLQSHHVEYVVGNYWRVVPIRAAMPGASQAISPLQGCTQKTTVLTSSSWRPNLLTHSFAYLLTNQPLSVPQQMCSKRTLTWAYGEPTAEVIISGPQSAPQEVLLIYDSGAAGVRHP